jgi:hypothetical protein
MISLSLTDKDTQKLNKKWYLQGYIKYQITSSQVLVMTLQNMNSFDHLLMYTNSTEIEDK